MLQIRQLFEIRDIEVKEWSCVTKPLDNENEGRGDPRTGGVVAVSALRQKRFWRRCVQWQGRRIIVPQISIRIE